MLQAVVYVSLSVLAMLLASLLLFACGYDRLTHPAAIGRDGIDRLKPAPDWTRLDTHGVQRGVPSSTGSWQYLIFVDHSLRSFPTIPAGVARLLNLVPGVEVLLLSQRYAQVTEMVLAAGGAMAGPCCAVVLVDEALYRRHNVRVMPFGIILDPTGRPRAEGLVDSGDKLLQMWRHARYAESRGRALSTDVMVSV